MHYVIVLSLLLFATPGIAKDRGRGDPAARLLSGEFASERWEFTARFDSGHLLFTEVLITNIGLGDRNAAVIGHIIEPEGKVYEFRNGRREGAWNLSADGLRIEVGSSLLNQQEPVHTLGVSKRSVRVDLRFRPDGPVAWSDKFVPSGYALDLLDAAVPVEGTLWARGMKEPASVRGTAAFTHSWVSKAESDVLLRRVEFFSLQGEYSIYFVDLTPPEGSRSRWLVVTHQGRTIYETQDFELSFDGSVGKSKDYAMPGTLQLKSEKIAGQVQVDRVLLRYNPLDDLPQPFRWLVSLKARPQRAFALSPFE
ncbi:MAG: hypothetical protein ACRERD_32295, partial [Candidatus Binatia bacterium]